MRIDSFAFLILPTPALPAVFPLWHSLLPQSHNNSNNTSNAGGGEPSKKEDYRRYLEKTGVLDALTKVLVGLYEEPERPVHPLDYIRRYLGAPTAVDVEGLKRENEALKQQVERLKKQAGEKE